MHAGSSSAGDSLLRGAKASRASSSWVRVGGGDQRGGLSKTETAPDHSGGLSESFRRIFRRRNPVGAATTTTTTTTIKQQPTKPLSNFPPPFRSSSLGRLPHKNEFFKAAERELNARNAETRRAMIESRCMVITLEEPSQFSAGPRESLSVDPPGPPYNGTPPQQKQQQRSRRYSSIIFSESLSPHVLAEDGQRHSLLHRRPLADSTTDANLLPSHRLLAKQGIPSQGSGSFVPNNNISHHTSPIPANEGAADRLHKRRIHRSGQQPSVVITADLRHAPPPPKHIFRMRGWMSDARIQDRRVWDICFPGTHNSASWALADPRRRWGSVVYAFLKLFIHCQSIDIYEQLCLGIRFLDLRVCKNLDRGGEPFCAHGGFRTVALRDVLEQIGHFCSKNPSEVVLMSIRRDVAFRHGPAAIGVIECDFWVAALLKRYLGRELEADTTIAELAGRRQNVIYFFEERERYVPVKEQLALMHKSATGTDLEKLNSSAVAGVDTASSSGNRFHLRADFLEPPSNDGRALSTNLPPKTRRSVVATLLSPRLGHQRQTPTQNVSGTETGRAPTSPPSEAPLHLVTRWVTGNMVKFGLDSLDVLPDSLFYDLFGVTASKTDASVIKRFEGLRLSSMAALADFAAAEATTMAPPAPGSLSPSALPRSSVPPTGVKPSKEHTQPPLLSPNRRLSKSIRPSAPPNVTSFTSQNGATALHNATARRRINGDSQGHLRPFRQRDHDGREHHQRRASAGSRKRSSAVYRRLPALMVSAQMVGWSVVRRHTLPPESPSFKRDHPERILSLAVSAAVNETSTLKSKLTREVRRLGPFVRRADSMVWVAGRDARYLPVCVALAIRHNINEASEDGGCASESTTLVASRRKPRREEHSRKEARRGEHRWVDYAPSSGSNWSTVTKDSAARRWLAKELPLRRERNSDNTLPSTEWSHFTSRTLRAQWTPHVETVTAVPAMLAIGALMGDTEAELEGEMARTLLSQGVTADVMLPMSSETAAGEGRVIEGDFILGDSLTAATASVLSTPPHNRRRSYSCPNLRSLGIAASFISVEINPRRSRSWHALPRGGLHGVYGGSLRMRMAEVKGRRRRRQSETASFADDDVDTQNRGDGFMSPTEYEIQRGKLERQKRLFRLTSFSKKQSHFEDVPQDLSPAGSSQRLTPASQSASRSLAFVQLPSADDEISCGESDIAAISRDSLLRRAPRRRRGTKSPVYSVEAVSGLLSKGEILKPFEILTPFKPGRTRILKSWSQTTDPEPTFLCRKLAMWAKENGQSTPRQPFILRILAGEVTPPSFGSPDGNMDTLRFWTFQGASALVLKNGGLRAAATKTHEILLAKVLRPGLVSLLNGVTHDFVNEHIVSRIIKLNILHTLKRDEINALREKQQQLQQQMQQTI